jgi:tetratricopeptide (TPR) repeat protein
LSLLAQAHIKYYLNAPTLRKDDQERKDNSKLSAQRYAGRAIDLEPAWPESQITYSKLLSAVEGPVRGEIYLKELIKAYPYTLEYRIALAEFYNEYEKFTESAAVYDEVIAIDPKNKKANFGLAEAYRILNKPDQAQRFYNAASALDPSDVEPMFANAKLLIETASGREIKAKNEQALAKLELVKKINPDFPKVSFFMARCYLELGDFAKAIEMIKDEKTRNPNIADSYILAAEIFNRQGQFKECAAEYSSAIKIRPNSAELYVRASTCYRLSDALDIAHDMLDMAYEKESGFADLYREYGYLFEKNGKKSEANQYFQKYLILSPNAPDRDAVTAKVRELGGTP